MKTIQYLYHKHPCPAYIPKEIWDSHHHTMMSRAKPFPELWADHLKVFMSFARDERGDFVMENGEFKRVIN